MNYIVCRINEGENVSPTVKGNHDQNLKMDENLKTAKSVFRVLFSDEQELWAFNAKPWKEGFEVPTRSSNVGRDQYLTLVSTRIGKYHSNVKICLQPNWSSTRECIARFNVYICLVGEIWLTNVLLAQSNSLHERHYTITWTKKWNHKSKRLELNDLSTKIHLSNYRNRCCKTMYWFEKIWWLNIKNERCSNNP